MEAIVAASAVPENNLAEENESVELQPLSFLSSDISLDTRQLIEIIEENNTGIEKAVRHSFSKDDKEDEEQEEYVKDFSYESENSYVQKNPYAPKKDYERIEHIKPKEEEEEKSFLWK
ncbi:MAG: hypothetical protein WC852_00660 [Candidatus Nanoarchaeia archaeon]|jgi:hypothetical protein